MVTGEVDAMRRAWAAMAALAMGFELLAGASPAQAAVNNDTTVQAWYRTFLGRTDAQAKADSGRYYWVDRLDRGARPSDVVWALLHSEEYANREVSSYYNLDLGRAPDAGAAYWINSVAHRGMALEWVEQNVLASEEFFQRFSYGDGDATPVVRLWYFDILGRGNPSDGELRYWADRVRRVGRLQAVREIWYSDEGVRNRINQNYQDVLLRSADFGGVQYWYPKEVESDVNVKTLLASTPEFISTRVY